MDAVFRLNNLRLAPLTLFISAIVSGGLSHHASARDYFNPALLELGNPQHKGTDLTAFEQGDQAPGTYRVDVIINDEMVDTREIEFRQQNAAEGNTHLQPCLSVKDLKSLGVKTELFPGLTVNGDCVDLSAIPQANAELQFAAQKLFLSIPQAALSPVARGYVPPEQWDEGIPALLLNYSFSGANYYASGGSGEDSNNQYANLRPGLNIGPWRVRNYTTWNRDSSGQDSWDTIYTYAQRNIVALRSQLTLGDSSSPSDVFDAMPFRGGQLASDDDMLPDSLRGYAPVVRGIARTNAQVTIRQNGYVIYQSYVAPGAFEITDMYPTGGSGDLDVTIKEADGSEQHLTVPFASLPVLQREGRLKYSVTGGLYRSYNNSVDSTPFAQATAIYGLPHGFTLYGGVQESSHYQSLAAGLGKNMGDFGAFSTDVTQAWSTPQGQAKSSGQSWRVRYSKNLVETGTNFAIAGYRYSTNGYYGMQEVLDSYGDSSSLRDRRRNRTEFTISQTLGQQFGALSLSAVKEDYWNSAKSMESYSVGYNNSWKGISWGVNYSYNKNTYASGSNSANTYDHDQIVSFNVSLPLDRWLRNTWVNYNLNTSQHGNTTHSVGLNGAALADNNLSWGIQQGYTSNGQGNSGSLTADYKGTYGEVQGGYAYDKNSERLNYGFSGGVLVHGDGVTLSQPLGETVALVKVPGASGVGVNGQTGVKTDWRGYTVATNLTPYRKNDLTLNTETFGDEVDLDLTTSTRVPTRGAVVRAEYKANVGHRALMTLTQANGDAVPFGATVTVEGNDNQGYIVGDGGQVYLTGLAPRGAMTISWGKGAGDTCKLNYELPGTKSETGVLILNGVCR